MDNKRYFLKLLILLTIFFIGVTFVFNICSTISYADDEDETEPENTNISIQELNEIETLANLKQEPVLNAKSAIIYDRASKRVLWGKNIEDKRAMASTTKIMTAIVVLENSNLSDIITISKKAAGTGGSRLKLNAGDKISVNDLLYGLMLRSR